MHGDLQRTSFYNRGNRQHELSECQYRSGLTPIAKKVKLCHAQQKREEIISGELQMSGEQIERDEYFSIVLIYNLNSHIHAIGTIKAVINNMQCTSSVYYMY